MKLLKALVFPYIPQLAVGCILFASCSRAVPRTIDVQHDQPIVSPIASDQLAVASQNGDDDLPASEVPMERLLPGRYMATRQSNVIFIYQFKDRLCYSGVSKNGDSTGSLSPSYNQTGIYMLDVDKEEQSNKTAFVQKDRDTLLYISSIFEEGEWVTSTNTYKRGEETVEDIVKISFLLDQDSSSNEVEECLNSTEPYYERASYQGYRRPPEVAE